MTARYEHTTDGPARGHLRLLQLYPRDMNIYGDWGNTLVLARRAQWQGYDVELLSYDPGDELPGDIDILVGGGGQDSGQDRIKEDLVTVGPTLKAWAADGVPMLAICGLYQLFGHGFTTAKGQEIPGISLMDAHTVAGDTRLIGNITLDTEDFGTVVGYENHSGLTTLGPGARPPRWELSGTRPRRRLPVAPRGSYDQGTEKVLPSFCRANPVGLHDRFHRPLLHGALSLLHQVQHPHQCAVRGH